MIESGDATALQRLMSDGFFLIPLPRSIQHTLRAAFDAARRFFRLPPSEKAANGLPEECGYRPTGIEYSQSPMRPDPIESFTASVRTIAAATHLRSAEARHLHDVLAQCLAALEPIAEELLIGLASELSGIDQERLHGGLRRWSCVQVNYARPSENAQEFVNELHEDGHLMTLACATAPGLELAPHGATPVPVLGSVQRLVAMPGEIGWLLSGGLINPLYHRVRRNPHERERMALLYFCDIDPSLCQPWRRNEVNANVDIGARVLTNSTRFGLRGFSPD